jgi:hypothetical protein
MHLLHPFHSHYQFTLHTQLLTTAAFVALVPFAKIVCVVCLRFYLLSPFPSSRIILLAQIIYSDSRIVLPIKSRFSDAHIRRGLEERGDGGPSVHCWKPQHSNSGLNRFSSDHTYLILLLSFLLAACAYNFSTLALSLRACSHMVCYEYFTHNLLTFHSIIVDLERLLTLAISPVQLV